MADRKSRLFTDADYKQLVKDVRIANQRIVRLTNKYGERSWAVNSLYNKLEDPKVMALTRYGNVKINRGMSDVKLKYIQQAVNEFKESQTSKIRGAELAIKNTKQSIKEHYSDIGNNLTDEQAGKLYNIVEDRNLRDYSELFDPSETWARLIRAKEQNLTFDRFTNLFKKDANINDLDVRNYLKEIYDMYMK